MARERKVYLKIQVTKNYALFVRSAENRHPDTSRHKALVNAMRKYGFLPCYPIICYRNLQGKLVVKDGQNRLQIAQSLGLPVYWIETDIDFDVAEINCTPRVWVLKDFAKRFASNGLAQYQDGLDFADRYGLSIGTAFALLGGVTNFSTVQDDFVGGRFEVKDQQWAEDVASLYRPLVDMAPKLKRQCFVSACMACCRVEGFDRNRIINGAKRNRDKLIAYADRDEYLELFEYLYNHKRSQNAFPLKFHAIMAMRKRNPATKGEAA